MILDEYLLHDAKLQENLYPTGEILLEFIDAAPRCLPGERVAFYIDRPLPTVLLTCEILERQGLLRRVPLSEESWSLSVDPASVNLEDVARTALLLCDRCKPPSSWPGIKQRAHPGIEILFMQATIGASQALFGYLKRIPLARARLDDRSTLRNTRGNRVDVL